MDTLNDVLRQWAEEYPERHVFTFFDRHGRHSVCTPKELYHLAGRFAVKLKKQGFQEDDIICNAVLNSVERLVTDYGILLAGCIPVNCQVVELDGTDFWDLAQVSGCVGAIVPVRDDNPSYNLFKTFFPDVIPDSGCVNVSITQAPKLRTMILVDRYNINHSDEAPGRKMKLPSLLTYLRESEEDIYIHHSSKPSNTAYIFQTSGSTGFSKLIARSHQEVLGMARAVARTPADQATKKIFVDRPFGWIGGFAFGFFSSCASYVTQDFFDGQQAQNVRELWNGIAEEKCCRALILYKDVISLVEEFKTEPPDFKLDVLSCSGQPMTKTVVEAIGILTKAMRISYSSTEAFAIASKYIATKADYQDYICGLPVSCTDSHIRVVDEDMNDLEPGEEGRIIVKTSYLLHGYYNREPASPIFTPGGWYITGDWGWLAESGDLFVSGRQDNVIHHGPILVYPSWPESVLVRHPDVKEAAVLGIPDAIGGSKLCACVVLKTGSSLSKTTLSKFYEDSFTHSSRQEYNPTLSFIEFFDVIPKTFNSKIDLRRLRRAMTRKLSEI